MGTLKYDGVAVQFEDRLLAHLQVIIVQKLRRQESFLMSWFDTEDLVGGRSSIWLHPAALLFFTFDSRTKPPIDRPWLDKLMVSANSPMGLFVADEHGDAINPTLVEIL
jgi:hypothetical protein